MILHRETDIRNLKKEKTSKNDVLLYTIETLEKE